MGGSLEGRSGERLLSCRPAPVEGGLAGATKAAPKVGDDYERLRAVADNLLCPADSLESDIESPNA
jgi:hypothetical protein